MPRTPLAVCFVLLLGVPAGAADERPQLETNQGYIEQLLKPTQLSVSDPMAVFGFVFGSLPDRVRIYPTENYYYFGFLHNGVRYSGNIRLDVADRDAGKLHFAFYEDRGGWGEEGAGAYRLLDRANGVTVERVERFLYRVAYGDKAVLFELNDLSSLRPPANAMGAEEKFLGPVFDESGIRFFLLFNPRLKTFHYVLDETVKVADDLYPSDQTDRILIGKRTGFAYYRDHRLDRKILIGVFEANGRANNFFDGPFDQLPDNFLQGDALRDAILAVAPNLKGKLDRFGAMADGSNRYLIAPYAYYASLDELLPFHRCAESKRVPAARYYACFVNDEAHEPGTPARPLALERSAPAAPRRPPAGNR